MARGKAVGQVLLSSSPERRRDAEKETGDDSKDDGAEAGEEYEK